MLSLNKIEPGDCDLLIIGGGPAGLTAAIYASRYGIDVKVVTKEIGGQISLTEDIENYPGFPEGITGEELGKRMKKQAEKFGAEVGVAEIKNIKKQENNKIEATADFGKINAKAVLLVMGSHYRKLGLPKERELTGKGVSYCATCDGPLFKGKDVLVVGGGDTALEEAMYLDRIGVNTTLIHRREEYRAHDYIVNQFKESDVKPKLSRELHEIKGEKKVEGAILKNNKTEELEEIDVDGIFIFIGTEPNTELVEDLEPNILNERGYIKTDENFETEIDGLFAAGDITGGFEQAIVAASEGAEAAKSIKDYVAKFE